MIVLVTGGTGFIARSLLRRLCAEKIRTRATYRGKAPGKVPGLEWHQADLNSDAASWSPILAGADCVVHLAALAHQIGRAGQGRWEEFRRTNVEATEALARSCARTGIRRLVFLSSVAAERPTNVDHAHPDLIADGQTDYGRSKFEAEQAIQRELTKSRTDWCILRPPLVYGPGNPGNMERLLRLIHSGLPLPFGSVRNLRSFIFVENLVDALLTVLRFPDPVREVLPVTDGTDLSTRDLIETLAACSGRRARLVPVPVVALRRLASCADVISRFTGRSLPFDSYSVGRLTESLIVDGSQFRAKFSWQPPVEPRRALELTCASVRESRAVQAASGA